MMSSGHGLKAAAGTDRKRVPTLRQRTFELVELARPGDRASRIVDIGLLVLIVANAAAVVLETVPSIEARYGRLLWSFEVFSVLVFTLEYAGRIWTAVEMPFLSRKSPAAARFHLATRPHMLIDLVAILPFYLAFLLPFDLRLLRVVRIFRILKLSRFSPTMHTLMRVIANERRTLLGTLMLFGTLLLFAASAAYLAEREAQPDKFGSIPEAAWWAIATLTTVGYGDITPVTVLGKLVGAVTMIAGVIVLALPIAVIASSFAAEVGQRDFVVTWPLLSRIPALSDLNAEDIGRMIHHLKALHFDAHREVISPEDEADAMFFIVSGAVRVRTSAGETIFQTGEFFGELAMLEARDHTHAYRTVSPTKLLRLSRADFLFLCETHPRVTDHIAEVAKSRREARDGVQSNALKS